MSLDSMKNSFIRSSVEQALLCFSDFKAVSISLLLIWRSSSTKIGSVDSKFLSQKFFASSQVRPPTVAFTWRHWGNFEGRYKSTPATGEIIEMFGNCVAKVNEQQKIQSVDVYFDPNIMMAELTGGATKSTGPFSNCALI
ncbi:uncharacterized protein LOC123528447 [Mercenaria mercenaria]|uniref:uncharacterized protein LOC123528447 n=1 Tax=Mercenaria mercenaria TaxID=6596 RepID=UPI00234F2176|nr:uncharacterized protein LOC123528447 [Mercenaria mercenaria]